MVHAVLTFLLSKFEQFYLEPFNIHTHHTDQALVEIWIQNLILILMKTLDDWYRNNLLTDVTLVCDDRFRIECHRMVLCASSPLLRDFITINAQSRPLIYLKGVKGPTLSVIMQFLYTGEVSIHQEELPSVLEAARELDIVELQELKDTQSPKPNNVFKEEETCLTPYVNTPSFSEMRIAEPKKIIDSSYKCGDCEFRGKSQKQLLEHVEMLHTVDDYIAKDAFDIVDVLDTTNQEPMIVLLLCHSCIELRLS